MPFRKVTESGAPEYGMLAKIATKLQKIGGGEVSRQAVGQLLAKYDADEDWYQGKKQKGSPWRIPYLGMHKEKSYSM